MRRPTQAELVKEGILYRIAWRFSDESENYSDLLPLWAVNATIESLKVEYGEYVELWLEVSIGSDDG